MTSEGVREGGGEGEQLDPPLHLPFFFDAEVESTG